MSAGDFAQILVNAAALVSAITALVVAVRGHALATATSRAVNGQAEQINTLREAKGFREGVSVGMSADPTAAVPPVRAQIEMPNSQ
jgi:hypothetical protein